MSWTVRHTGSHTYRANDGTRDRAEIYKVRSHWLVMRLGVTLDGREKPGGVDTFRSFAAAKSFVTENPGVWGR